MKFHLSILFFFISATASLSQIHMLNNSGSTAIYDASGRVRFITLSNSSTYNLYTITPYEIKYSIGKNLGYPIYCLPDINGNQAPEIVCFSMNGSTNHVRVVDSKTNEVIFDFGENTSISYPNNAVALSENGTILIFITRQVSTVNYGETYVIDSVSSNNIADPKLTHNQFKLYQNYPNPFNPSTTISYSLEKAGNVKIEIFGNNGELINLLRDEFQNVGAFEVTWNGDDKSGAKVASGFYFYQISIDGFSQARKMILMK